MSQDTIPIRRPDDWHLHLRDGEILRAVLAATVRQFARAIIMPNLVPPVTTPEAARAYRERILSALPPGSQFQPLMTCYLTDESDPHEIARGHAEGVFTAAKLYPAHATTNADFGVTDVTRIYRVFERMEQIGMPLLVHGEATDPAVDVFDREQVFLDQTLIPLLERFPTLKVVLEHVTTVAGVQLVAASSGRLGATVTPHHLMINRNAMFAGGIRPHMYCLPVAKREADRQALRKAVTSGMPWFFLGTDSAPHLVSVKETECGRAGIFNAPVALACYAQVFDEEGALDRLEAFASLNGPRFYGLPVNEGTITLYRRPQVLEGQMRVGDDTIRPFLAGEKIAWSLASLKEGA
jgi:dihydroorotase